MPLAKHLWRVDLVPSTTPNLLTVENNNRTLRISNPNISTQLYPVTFESTVNALLYLSQIKPDLTWDEFKRVLKPLRLVICPHMDRTVAVLHPIYTICPHCQRPTDSTLIISETEPAYPNVVCPNCGQTFSVEPRTTQQNLDPNKGGTI